MSVLDNLPRSWLTSVTVHRGGGRDSKGNPLPGEQIHLMDCLIGARSTSDPVDRSDVVDGKAVLYRGPGFVFHSQDVVEVPDGARMAGRWMVDGRPAEWPYGWEVGLVPA